MYKNLELFPLPIPEEKPKKIKIINESNEYLSEIRKLIDEIIKPKFWFVHRRYITLYDPIPININMLMGLYRFEVWGSINNNEFYFNDYLSPTDLFEKIKRFLP